MCDISVRLNAQRGINSALECVRLDFILQGASAMPANPGGVDLGKREVIDGRALTKAAILGFLGGYAACHEPGCLLRQLFETVAGDVEHEFNEAASSSHS